MGLSQSRVYFHCLKLIASQLICPLEFDKMVSEFQCGSHDRVNELKLIFVDGKLNANIGRLLTFLRFLQELKLTEEEWEEMYQFLTT